MGRTPKRNNPMAGLRGVSKKIRATEEQWSEMWATKKDVCRIVELYLDKYDEAVMERWWFRMKIPARYLGRRVAAVRDWLKRLFTRKEA